ncbi:thermonuclease family protein [Candidatus Pacearchaeota archaeon]|nr:thermonuclease family protein [Candidatus Pacearchaeota archaeon]
MNRKTEAFKKDNLIILAALLIIFLITILLYLINSFSDTIPQTNSKDNAIAENTVTRIIDGDTFEMSNGKIIRLLCIDTPEKNQPKYEEAKQFLSDLILNKEVRMEKGISDKDKYGRLLRYVYVAKENIPSPCAIKDTIENTPRTLSDEVCITIGTPEDIFVNKEIIDNNYSYLFIYGNETCNELKDS